MLFRLARLLSVIFSIFAALFFLWKWNTVPQGEFFTTWFPGKESPFIYGFGPAEAIEIDSDGFSLRGERAVFKISPPSNFKELEVEISYDMPEAPAVLLSAITSLGSMDENRVLYSRVLEQITWRRRELEGLSLWESQPSERSFLELIEGRVPLKTVGLRVPRPIGRGTSRDRTYRVSLRGGHTFWILPGESRVEFELLVQNMNRHPGEDPISIEVGDGRRVLKRAFYPDKNEDIINSPEAPERIKLAVPESNGPLEIKLRATEDIFIREFRTNAARLVMANRIFLGDDVGFGGKSFIPVLWTDSARVSAKTPHREGRQTIYFAGRQLPLEQSGEVKTLGLSNVPGGLLPIKLSKNDLELSVAGFISFSSEDFFAPSWPELDFAAPAPPSGVILASYAAPSLKEGVFVSKAKFKTDKLYRDQDGSYIFFIDLPGIASDERVRIKQISFTAKK